MNITETCTCGASFDVTADSGDALNAVLGWRNSHLHQAWPDTDPDEPEDDE